ASSRRRQKSPAVVGSGMRRGPGGAGEGAAVGGRPRASRAGPPPPGVWGRVGTGGGAWGGGGGVGEDQGGGAGRCAAGGRGRARLWMAPMPPWALPCALRLIS